MARVEMRSALEGKMTRAFTVAMGLTSVLGCAARTAGVTPITEPAAAPTSTAVELPVSGGTLHGTLLVPSGTQPRPVALIIAGSGPTDRDGNNPILPGKNNSLKMLAEGLSQHGIASVRYDKRGIAASAAAGPSEPDLRFDTYVDDAAAWIAWVSKDQRFSSVSIIGHSEGSLVGIMTAQRVDLDGFVSIAGVARPVAEVLREQLRPRLPTNLWNESERILGALTEGRTAAQVPPVLNSLYRPSVQPYLISWLRLNPAAEVGRFRAPMMIVQGTTDIQVPVADARALHAARPDAELVIIEGMNHLLKLVSADVVQQQSSYSDPALPVAPELIDRVSAFLLRVKR